MVDGEKANLMNEYFASVRKRLAAGYAQLPATTANNPALVPQISNVSLSTDVIKKKLNAQKSGKSTGPGNVSPSTQVHSSCQHFLTYTHEAYKNVKFSRTGN